MRSRSVCFDELREYISTLPIVDCHDHAAGMEPVEDVLAHLCTTYLRHDLVSASSVAEIDTVMNLSAPLEDRWEVFERAWGRTRHTGYGVNALKAFEKAFGEKSIGLDSV